MSKIKVYELAKELEKPSKELVEFLVSKNIEVKSHMSAIESSDAELVRKAFGKKEKPEGEAKSEPKAETPGKKKIVQVFRPQNTQSGARQGRRSGGGKPSQQMGRPMQVNNGRPSKASAAGAKPLAQRVNAEKTPGERMTGTKPQIERVQAPKQPERVKPAGAQEAEVQPEKIQAEKIQPVKAQPDKVQTAEKQPEKVSAASVQEEKVQAVKNGTAEKPAGERVQPDKMAERSAHSQESSRPARNHGASERGERPQGDRRDSRSGDRRDGNQGGFRDRFRTDKTDRTDRRDEVFLHSEFEAYGQVYLATEDGSAGIKGTVMDAIRENGLEADVIYACGPKPMLRAVKAYAETNHITAWISMEERMACGIGACLACVCESKDRDEYSHVHNKRVCKDGPVFDAREVELG